ncbi:MAG: DHH family phosphoesterase [Candidatus Omnitrophota bacterium]|jgi:phosphoesterase RecJ-like protein
MHGLALAKRQILKVKDIAISGHVNPDGDSLGSLLSLGLGLEKLGKRVYMLSQDKIPPHYKFLPGVKRLQKTLKKRVDLAIAVDCGAKHLLGRNQAVFEKAKAVLEIDHHQFRKPFGDIQLLDHQAAAVGELVYLLLKRLKVGITPEIAENLLVSIIVETNSFQLPGVRPLTFSLCSGLLKKDIDFPKLIDTVYASKTKEAVILSGICLARCKFLKGGKIVWSIIRQRDFLRVKGKDYDADTVANEMRSIKGVRIVVLFREKSKRVLRVSLRSKGGINIATVVEKYNGGGHFDIAGCYLPNHPRSIKGLLSQVEDLLS